MNNVIELLLNYWILINASYFQAVRTLGMWGLFTRGLPLRIIMVGTLTGAQWATYDAFKVLVGLYVHVWHN